MVVWPAALECFHTSTRVSTNCKTSKTEVFPGFCKIEPRNISGCMQVIWQPCTIEGFCLPKIYDGTLDMRPCWRLPVSHPHVLKESESYIKASLAGFARCSSNSRAIFTWPTYYIKIISRQFIHSPMMTMVDGMPMAVPQLATIQAHL